MVFLFYSLPVSLVSVVAQIFSVGCILKLQDEKQAISFFSKKYAQELEALERLEQQLNIPLQESITSDLEKETEILSTLDRYTSQVHGHDRLLWEKYYFSLCYEKQKRVDQANCVATEPISLVSFEEPISKGISRKKLK